MKILLIEDESELLVNIQTYLEDEPFTVSTATTFRQAAQKVHDYAYDCVVVDIMLPDGTGLALIEQLKEAHSQAGIIIISAKNSPDDRINGLYLGADDYLSKPFYLPELNARIRALIRRRQHAGEKQLLVGSLTFLLQRNEVKVADHVLPLAPKEYALLLFMVTNKGRLLTKEGIAEHIWGEYTEDADSLEFLYTHIRNLRKKLTSSGCPDYIKSRYGVGYLLTVEP
ncbi:response regulator transcription factor [Spirosoma sp. BT702]|uniref:Response regulator transcription factor n=1 Tax=Spirosoma profusum TaxID=2771354 RepID=A0A927AVN3_9BACT|nr:response regulator transcription factor [Spirosoma profusum]MBD2705236.1 response regulator transcription factor [Spirosoma profusum]